MTAYRNDTDALAARDEVLARELADKQRERAVVQRLLEEARAADAAAALDNDVRVGRRRLNRLAIGLTVLVVAGVAASALVVNRSRGVATVASPVAEPDETLFSLALAAKGLTPVELEPRFIAGVGGVATTAEVDALVGAKVAPWEPFMYAGDAQVRLAVASPLYRGGDVEPTPDFVSDGYGGVWRVERSVPRAAVLTHASALWSRKIWLLPLGSAFRGVAEIATQR